MAFSTAGDLFVASHDTSTVAKFDASGTYVPAGSIPSTHLQTPFGVAIDASGNLYVANADDNTVAKFEPDGTFLMSWSTAAAPRFVTVAPVPEPSTSFGRCTATYSID